MVQQHLGKALIVNIFYLILPNILIYVFILYDRSSEGRQSRSSVSSSKQMSPAKESYA